MNGRYLIIAQLWIHPEMEEQFVAFEKKAAVIMSEHGGKIEQAFRSEGQATIDDEFPFETHVISFPSIAKFEAYLSDPDTVSLAKERATIIRKMDAWACADCSGAYLNSERGEKW